MHVNHGQVAKARMIAMIQRITHPGRIEFGPVRGEIRLSLWKFYGILIKFTHDVTVIYQGAGFGDSARYKIVGIASKFSWNSSHDCTDS